MTMHSVEAEEAVLGAMLISAEDFPTLADFLAPTDFFELKHQWVWEAMLALYQKGETIDYLTVSSRLRNNGTLDTVGGSSFLTGLLNSVPSHTYAEAYARLVERAACRRKLLKAASEIASLVNDGSRDLEAVYAEVERVITAALDAKQTDTLTSIGNASQAYQDALERRSKSPDGMAGISSGYRGMDTFTNGLAKGEFSLIAARPGVGKTALMLNMMHRILFNKGRAVFFSLEMDSDAVMTRLYALDSGVSISALRNASLTGDQWDAFLASAERLNLLAGDLDCSSHITPQSISRRLSRLQRKGQPIDIVFIDYLQLIGSSEGGRKADNQNTELERIAQQLKGLALTHNVHVCAAAQLSRQVEYRADKTPQLSDLRGSGGLEQAADIVIAIRPPDKEVTDSEAARYPLTLSILKQRNGRMGNFRLYTPALTKFSDMQG